MLRYISSKTKMVQNAVITGAALSSSSLSYSSISNNNNATIVQPFSLKKQWFDVDSLSTYSILRSQISPLTNSILSESTTTTTTTTKSSTPTTTTSTYQPMFNSINATKIPGDYSISNVFHLSRAINSKPETVIGQLTTLINDQQTKRDKRLIEKVEVINKHLNLTLSQQYLEECVRLWCLGESSNSSNSSKQVTLDFIATDPIPPRKRVLVDFASPNMSKELHVGHLRSIALGESVCRILEYRGHEVERISHVGDFGTPMGMVISHALDEKAPFLSHIWGRAGVESDDSPAMPVYKEMPYIPTPKEMSEYYAAAKQRTKTDKQFEVRAQLTAAELQKGPPNFDNNGNNSGSHPDIYQAWQSICQASREGFNQIFKLMNVNVNERGESYYRTMLENGAQCIFLNGNKVPVIIKKRDGAYLYATTDLAAIKSRIESGKEWIVVITDDSQNKHFEDIFSIARLAGWLKEEEKHDGDNVRVDHLSFGVVRSENGSKLSSRDGNPLALSELVEESVKRAKQASITSKSLSRAETIDPTHTAYRVEEPARVSDTFENNDQDNQDDENVDIMKNQHYLKVGISAIKYYDLVQRSNSYRFSYDNILSFKGNTSIYLNYSLTRIATIMRRAKTERGFDIEEAELNIASFQFQEFTENERRLVVMISKFADTLKSAEGQLRPAIICDYLWDVADTFHRFYETDTVLGSDRQHQRLLICNTVKKILETGFYLLGVEPVERL
ncbi:arginyl-tRNA synthetase [Cavenderia fasciculata]|uniref:arginine--tRNA ligase n=1 Tax=Cavenderia fasciculata TaxID=261658 RepID=F4PUY4_CACFS|nr:arginyl-tRNA synthetase [Cavenderia fasciculata]EGG21946.1 arginyl-tRNA synthetase [Cavenderia fasciculata]|eukprot:XP_004359797.1 arginyl-tRNA synthetase [Cavenderia fasciculata]